MEPEVEHHVHESPLSMTGVLMVLALLSAIGGFVAVPHFLEPLLPLPQIPEALHHFEMPLLILSVVIAVGRPRRGLVRLPRRDGAGRPALARRSRGCTACSANKYLSTRSTRGCSAGRSSGSPSACSCDLGDRFLLDGSLNGLARLAHRTAGVFSRVQTGNLHLYALFVLAGSHRRAGVELPPWLTPACSTSSCSSRSPGSGC